MKLNLLLIPLLLFSSSCSNSICSSLTDYKEPEGKPDSTTVSLSDYNAIKASRAVNIVYTVSNSKPGAKIIAPSDLLPYVSVSVKDKSLLCTVSSDCPFQNYFNRLKIQITGPAVCNITSSSSAKIEFINLLSVSKPLSITASSSGKVLVSAVAPQLSAKASSSGSLTIAATVNSATLSASSSARIETAVKASQSIEAQTSSSGHLTLQGNATNAAFTASSSGRLEADIIASQTLSATASSSGHLTLTGTASNVNFTASSSGRINADKLKADTGTVRASSSGVIQSSIASLTSTSTSSSGRISNN